MVDEKKEIQARLVEGKIEIRKEELTEVLKIISPGTTLRTAIEGMQRAKTGGLIVAHNDAVENLFEGGFKINCRFTPQRIIELGKMDGAIILSKDLKKILHANVLLTPNSVIPSNETGTRHKAAERTAKQAETVVIAISQRRDEITLFYRNTKYVIKSAGDLIRKATEVMQILEKHKEIFEHNKKELDEEELKKKPRIIKALLKIQRGIMILKISETLKGYLIELGVEGTILKSRLKEILYRVEKDVDNVVRDYSKLGLSKSKRLLSILSYDELLEIENIKKCFGIYEETEFTNPKGHRLLEKAGVSEKEIGILVKNFKNLVAILELKKEDLIPFIEGEKLEEVFEKITHIKEG